MFQQAIPRSFLWFVSFCAILVIGITGCGGNDNDADDNRWVGTWSLETFDGQTLGQVLKQELATEGVTISIVTNNWTFNDDGTLEAEIGFKLENKGGDSGIAITSSSKTAGTYSLSGFNYTLTLEEIPIASLKDSAGTWYREGNILTLNSDDGSSIGFKKKQSLMGLIFLEGRFASYSSKQAPLREIKRLVGRDSYLDAQMSTEPTLAGNC